MSNSLGFQFLKSIVNNGSTNALSDVNESMFLSDPNDNELDAFLFAKDHLNRYNAIPSADAFLQAGFPLPNRAGDTVDFYIDSLKTRKTYNSVNAIVPEFIEKMGKRKMGEVREIAQRMLTEIDANNSPNAYSDMAREVGAVWADYQAYKWSGDGLRGITTGWASCDRQTLGAQPGDLIVIVGRPGMGKSYLLIESAHAANLMGRSSMIMSMEMTVKQLALRWLARRSGVNPLFIREGQISTWSEGRLLEAMQDIQHNSPPVFMEAGDMDKSVDAVEMMFRKHTPDIIYLDSAYLFSPSGRKQGFVSRWEAITSVINDLKKLALRLNRAIVITVQFNRNVKSSQSKEMDMADIGDSDAIPRNASIILGVRKHKEQIHSDKRYIQMMKNRDGENTDFSTLFQFAPVCFEECPHIGEMDDDETETTARTNNLDLSYMR